MATGGDEEPHDGVPLGAERPDDDGKQAGVGAGEGQVDLEHVVHLERELVLERVDALDVRVAVDEPHVVVDGHVEPGVVRPAARAVGQPLEPARDQAHVPEPRLLHVLDLVGELEVADDRFRVVLVHAQAASPARDLAQEVLAARREAGAVESDPADLVEHEAAGGVARHARPVAVQLDEVGAVDDDPAWPGTTRCTATSCCRRCSPGCRAACCSATAGSRTWPGTCRTSRSRSDPRGEARRTASAPRWPTATRPASSPSEPPLPSSRSRRPTTAWSTNGSSLRTGNDSRANWARYVTAAYGKGRPCYVGRVHGRLAAAAAVTRPQRHSTVSN